MPFGSHFPVILIVIAIVTGIVLVFRWQLKRSVLMPIEIYVSAATEQLLEQATIIAIALFDVVMCGIFIRRWMRATLPAEREKWRNIALIFTSIVSFLVVHYAVFDLHW